MEKIRLPSVKKIDQGVVLIVCYGGRAKEFFFLSSPPKSTKRDGECAAIKEALSEKKGSFLMKGKVEDAINALNEIIAEVEDSITLEEENIFG